MAYFGGGFDTTIFGKQLFFATQANRSNKDGQGTYSFSGKLGHGPGGICRARWSRSYQARDFIADWELDMFFLYAVKIINLICSYIICLYIHPLSIDLKVFKCSF